MVPFGGDPLFGAANDPVREREARFADFLDTGADLDRVGVSDWIAVITGNRSQDRGDLFLLIELEKSQVGQKGEPTVFRPAGIRRC